MPSLADVLAAQYGGQPVYEGGPDAAVTPADVLRALGGWGQNIAHQVAPGWIPRTGARAPQFSDSPSTWPDTPAQAAAKLSATRGKAPDPLEVMLGVAGGPQATFIAPGRVPGGAKLLKQFDKMLKAGATPEEARQATGINLNAMGQTQYEVSDAGSTFRMPTHDEFRRGGTLGQFFTNWKAGELVPELNQMRVVFNDPTFEARKGVRPMGFLDLSTAPPTVGLNPRALKTPEAMRDAVLHEAGGHGTAQFFGYPAGGSPYSKASEQLAQAALPTRKAAYENLINKVSERAGAWAVEQAGGDKAKAAQFIERYFELNPGEAELMKGALIERSKYNRGRMLLEEQFKAYEAGAGEEQARVIQKSKDMTQAELRASDPEKRSDRPYAQQFVIPQQAKPWPVERQESTELPSFSERMAQAQDIARDYRNAPAYKTARAPTVSKEFTPALRPDETKEDVLRGFTGDPTAGLEPPSIAELGRNAYRGFVPPEPTPSIADIGRAEYLARLGGGRQYSIKPTTEMTPIGEQYVLPGAERRPAAALQRQAEAPLKPTVAQEEPGGMFAQPGQGELQFLIKPQREVIRPTMADVLEGFGGPVTGAGAPYRPPAVTPTVPSPVRIAAPGIYGDPRDIAIEALGRISPEHPALQALFGVSRGDLAAIAQARKGNLDPYTLLPGWKPGSRGSEVGEAVANPKNAQRLIDILTEALKIPEVGNATGWYVMDPAFKRLEGLVGTEQAKKIWSQSNPLTAMASPGSEVPLELTRGTAASMLAEQGRFADFAKYAGIKEKNRWRYPNFPEELVDVPGHMYHKTSQVGPMGRFLETGEVQMQSPKVPLYIGASGVPETGFQTGLPIADVHFSGGIGSWDLRKAKKWRESMRMPEFQTVGPWYAKDVAAPAGLEPVSAQALQWTTLGPHTGVESLLGAPKLELLAQNVWERALRLGMDPQKLMDLVLQRKAHAVLPAVGAAGAAAAAMREGE